MVFTSAMIPFCVFTIRNFVISVPVELDEAAVIDGAGPLSLFFKIIMPLLKPTMVTCFILQFMTVWSDFLTPLYLSSKSRLFPDDNGCISVLRKEQELLELYFC
ncbi:MAG: ABC transporter permease subunit [Blautia massiliensis (ex Durand et al. 2017)]